MASIFEHEGKALEYGCFENEPAAPVLRMYIPDLKCPLELQQLQMRRPLDYDLPLYSEVRGLWL